MVSLYIHKNSIIHKCPFILKSLLVSIIITISYCTKSPIIFGSMIAISIALYFLAKLSLWHLLASFRTIWILLGGIILYHSILTNYVSAFLITSRILIALILAHLLSLTTPTQYIIKELSFIFTPLKHVGISPNIPGLMISVTLRTIPLLSIKRKEIFDSAKLRKCPSIFTIKHIHIVAKLTFTFLLQTIKETNFIAEALYLRGFSTKIRKGE